METNSEADSQSIEQVKDTLQTSERRTWQLENSLKHGRKMHNRDPKQ